MDDVEHIAELVKDTGVFSSFNGVLNARPENGVANLDRCAELQASGSLVHAQVSPRPQEFRLNWDTSITMMKLHSTWGKFINSRGAEKRQLLMDPAWRAAARDDWDTNLVPHNPLRRLHRMCLTEVIGEENQPWQGRSMAELVEERGGHVSDVLADWIIANDMNPGVVITSEIDAKLLSLWLTHPGAIIGNSDAGAHVQMFSSYGDSTLVLTRHVRERGDFTIEQAVHELTGRQAKLFHFKDRGVIAPGNLADLAVFRLEELDYAPPCFANDLPDGLQRFTRPPGGYRYTIAAGEITQENGARTAARPGRLLAP
jgi:N-acyl-D-aspartate/D-glutamate deacylase